MMSTVPHVTSGSGLRKFQADGFLLDRVYILSDDDPVGIGVCCFNTHNSEKQCSFSWL